MVRGGRRRAIVGTALVVVALSCGACANEPVTPAGSTAAPGATSPGAGVQPGQPGPGQPGAAQPGATQPGPPSAVQPGPTSGQPEPTGPTTLFGRVVDIPDPVNVVVQVQGIRVPVGVLGLDPTSVPACARADALTFAREALDGQNVTLVPDATLPVTSPRRAYVVLTTQESYTDNLIRAGWAAPAGQALYRPVYDGERRAAEAAGVGRWGPPCVSAG